MDEGGTEAADEIEPLADESNKPAEFNTIPPLDDGTEEQQDLLASLKGPQALEDAKEEAQRSTFKRDLDQSFVKKLESLAGKPGWWKDALADRELFIAMRGKYLNVYWRGQSLFMATNAAQDRIVVSTHPKFLMDPDLESQVTLLENGDFKVEDLQKNGFMSTYIPSTASENDHGTLSKIKRAARLFSGAEKIGCHKIAINQNNSVIDCEVQLPNFAAVVNANGNEGGRIDLVSVERSGDNAVLVFWEAKHYKNNELRAGKGPRAPVLNQIEKYKKYLSSEIKTINESYENVAKNLVKLKNMGQVRELSDIILEIGMGKRKLITEPGGPQVGLVVFGYDDAQRRTTRWAQHLQALRANIDFVITVGDPGAIRLIRPTTLHLTRKAKKKQ